LSRGVSQRLITRVRVQRAIGEVELRRVKQVEELGAKLEFRAFREAEILEGRKIDVLEAGTFQDSVAR
jgi:hypothetical protein